MGHKDRVIKIKPKSGGLGAIKAGKIGPSGRFIKFTQGRKGRRKEDSSETLGKFMKAKIDSAESTVKKGGMGADRVLSKYRNPEDAAKWIKSGGLRKGAKDAKYYKDIGLTGKRGEQAAKDFFKPDEIRLKNIMAGKYAKGGRAGLKHGGSAGAAKRGHGAEIK
jgi:hypothetical protein